MLPISSTSGWLASFEEMAKLKPRLIIPGHGNVCDLPKARRETADYLRLLITHMERAVNKGNDLQQAIDSLDQSAFAKLPNYDLLKGGNASRVHLEMESR
jgi:glyoxylase-like metal-dependent hydrolase (beta-lactamase superfamily II)